MAGGFLIEQTDLFQMHFQILVTVERENGLGYTTDSTALPRGIRQI